MKTLLALAVALTFSLPASAQTFVGDGCDLAYKKLAQHRDGSTCREQTVGRGLDGATDHGKTARRAEQKARAGK